MSELINDIIALAPLILIIGIVSRIEDIIKEMYHLNPPYTYAYSYFRQYRRVYF